MKLKDMPEVPAYIHPGSYAEQRKNRLDDCISDYLNDDDITPSDLYHDLIDVVTDWEKYHQQEMQKAQGVKNLIRGIQQPIRKKHAKLDSLD